MPNWEPLSRAAKSAKVDRATLSSWVKKGKLKSKSVQVRNLTATLVDVDQVRKLVGKGLKAGRPKKGR